MSWPARTWVTAELVTATIMNAYVRDPMAQLQLKSIIFGVGDINGDVIPTGQAFSGFEIPFTGTILGWTMTGDNAGGSTVMDVWRSSYAAGPPTVANTIAGSEKPTLATSKKGQDLVLTTWNTSVNAGDLLIANVDSNSLNKQVTVTLRVALA